MNQAQIEYQNYIDLTYREVYFEYCKSDLVIFASVHEGFGMPIIEAQAVGRPVIASRLPAIEEVGGDGVHFINNPLDAGEIRRGVSQLTNDANYRESLITRGKLNINRFQIDRVAEDYVLLYKQLYNRQHKNKQI